MRAVKTMADAVLDHKFDFTGRDSHWLNFGFPLNYQSDLVELCNILARLDYGPDPRLGRMLELILAAQTADGRWLKQYGTRVFQVEEKGQPSKWITIRARLAIKHTQRSIMEADRDWIRGR